MPSRQTSLSNVVLSTSLLSHHRPYSRLAYSDTADADTLMFNMVIADHCGKYCYAIGRDEFDAMIDELREDGPILKEFIKRFKADLSKK